MREFNDEKIVKTVQENSSYQIKTTSQSILQRYHACKQIGQDNLTLKRTKGLKVGLWTAGTLVACSAFALAVVFMFNKDSRSHNNITIANRDLENQLSTFSLFVGGKNESVDFKMSKRYFLNDNISYSKKEYFEEMVDTYDKYNLVIKNAFSSMRCIGEKYEQEIYGKYYKYIDKIYFENNIEPFAELYFNDEKIFDDNFDDTGVKYEALYITEGIAFDLTISKSLEKEANDIETYYSLLFMNRDGTTCYSVEKEHEIEGKESEFAYSMAIYASKSDFYNKNFIEKIIYEIENENGIEESELVVEKQGKQYNFENIINDGNKTTFEAYIELDDDKLNSLMITLIYQNNERLYLSDELSYTK